jgi:hypothetical protein
MAAGGRRQTRRDATGDATYMYSIGGKVISMRPCIFHL